MYGTGKLTNNPIWVFACAAIPFLIGIAERIWDRMKEGLSCKCCGKHDDETEEEEDMSPVQSELQRTLVLPMWILLSLTMLAGSIFLNVAAVIDVEPPNKTAQGMLMGTTIFMYLLILAGTVCAVLTAREERIGENWDPKDLIVEKKVRGKGEDDRMGAAPDEESGTTTVSQFE
jgi:hypothetical protein